MSKIKEFIDNNSMTTIDGIEIKLSDHFQEKDFIEDDNNVFVKLEALTRVSRKVFAGRIVGCRSDILSTGEPDRYAIIKVSYGIIANGESNYFEAIADCTTKNKPSGNPGKYLVCIAESRALSRVLRHLLGVPACSMEEVGEISNLDSVVSTGGPIESTQRMLIVNKFMNEKGKTLEDVSKVLGKEVISLDVLTKEEAALVIEKFNKKGG